ncbi:hypothetical protein ONS95_014295 [Cadophora gregata]|uniref:uncharacterized protein n=1 Tax=Cadophora gregata TaxID=51156 RepID=UPI0026DB4B2D|nr:uncharacterized protein ONS95_014295 [Cadophora gregata]KAK0114815.1 hypothetical protein ONS95_014295 [Cadophora gregata]
MLISHSPHLNRLNFQEEFVDENHTSYPASEPWLCFVSSDYRPHIHPEINSALPAASSMPSVTATPPEVRVPTPLTSYITTYTLTLTLTQHQNSNPNPDSNHYSTPNSNSKITIPLCTTCRSAVLPRSLLEHLRKQHALPAELRGLVRGFVDSLTVESRRVGFEDLEGWRGGCGNGDGVGEGQGDGEGEVVKGLRVVRAWRCIFVVGGGGSDNGSAEGRGGEGVGEEERERKREKRGKRGKRGEGKNCRGEGGKECGFIRRDVTDLRRHVNLVHGVGAKGIYEACLAQSWFGGRRAVYWKVGDGEGRSGADAGADAGGYENENGNEKARDGDGDVVMGETLHGEGTASEETSEMVERIVCEDELNEKMVHESEEAEGQEKRLKTPVFTSLCRWGFYGKGFGDKTPMTWRVKDGKETEIERELRLGKIC